MMRVTFFHTVRDNTGVVVDLDHNQLIDILRDSMDEEREPDEKTKAFLVCITEFAGTRSKANAIGAEVVAIDIDEGWTFDAATETCDRLATPYLIHTTTKSREGAHRFRVFLFLDRVVDAATYERVWLSLLNLFGVEGDTSTRDISRMSVLPAQWAGANHDLIFQRRGDPIDVDRLLQHYEVVRVVEPVRANELANRVFFDPLAEARADLRRMRNRDVDPSTLADLDDSPIVPRSSLEAALSAPSIKGQSGRTMKLLCACAASAIRQGYDVSEAILTDIGREFSRRIGKTVTPSEVRHDARSALRWATTHAQP